MILKDNQVFVCPECHSTCWGSDRLDDGTLMRHCHGVGCKYTWHESEDWSHMYEKASRTEKTEIRIEIDEVETIHLLQMLAHTTSSRRELLSGKEVEVPGIDTTKALECQSIEEAVLGKIRDASEVGCRS